MTVQDAVDEAAGLEELADDQRRSHIVVHRVVAALAQLVHLLHLHLGLALGLHALGEAAQSLPTLQQAGQALLGSL